MLTLILMTVLGSALALGTLFIGGMLLWYLLLALGRWQMFEKMGQSGWKAFIPIYSDYVLYGACWQTVYFWIALAAAFCAGSGDHRGLLASLAGMVAAALEFLLALRVSRSFGHNIPFAIGLTLFNPLFVLYLGFGPDRFRQLSWNRGV